MIRAYYIPFVLVLMTGCSSSHYNVEADYRPLEEIRERPDFLGDQGTITTIGDTAYVADLKKWLAAHPPGSPIYKAKLRHEQEHSFRQRKTGMKEWLAKYLTDTDYMWAAEQRGWYWEIKTLQANGQVVSASNLANVLRDYKNLKGRMVPYDVALAWVQSVLNGSWTPPADGP